MKNKIGYVLFTALILAFCLIPSVGMLLAEPEQAGGNQVLAPAPVLRDGEGNWNPDFLADARDYAGDHFFLRQRMITAWSAFSVNALHTSVSDSVILGSGGWLYYEGSLNDYTGAAPLTDREIFSAARNLALVQEYCAGQGARFLFTVAPNKNSLYPEHMPSFTVFSREHDADRLSAELSRQGVPYLDLFARFRGEGETLYFTRDSHWNSKGAALGADALNAALGRESAYFAGPFTPEANHTPDLYEMLYPTGSWQEEDLLYAGPLTFDYDAPIRSPENITIMTSREGKDGSLLMFRDSFGNLLYPYLADSFGRALFSRSTDYRLDLMAQRQADCVVVEVVERNLCYLVEHVPQMPAPEREAPAAPAPAEGTAALTAAAAQYVPGCVQITGTLPAEADTESTVCLLAGGRCYEAFLLEDGGFSLFVPESAAADGGLSVLFTQNGQTVSVPGLLA